MTDIPEDYVLIPKDTWERVLEAALDKMPKVHPEPFIPEPRDHYPTPWPHRHWDVAPIVPNAPWPYDIHCGEVHDPIQEPSVTKEAEANAAAARELFDTPSHITVASPWKRYSI